MEQHAERALGRNGMPHIVFDTELDFAYAKSEIRDHIVSYTMGKEAKEKGYNVKMWQVLVEVNDEALKVLEEKGIGNWEPLKE
jgi:hypothetical protein